MEQLLVPQYVSTRVRHRNRQRAKKGAGRMRLCAASSLPIALLVSAVHNCGALMGPPIGHSSSSAQTTTTSRVSVAVASRSDDVDGDRGTSNGATLDRRRLLERGVAFCLSGLLLPTQARAGLLDEFGSDPSKIQQAPKPQEVVPAKVAKGKVDIDPTLKGSYYYPTAKKRYLPRIKKVSDAISDVPTNIQSRDWEAVSSFADTVADNAILPMKLYTSSLDGQGLSMANEYAKTMKKDADAFEKKTRELQKAVKKQDSELALLAVSGMGIVLTEYREVGRLTGPDGGGDIPSVEDMRRMAMRKPTGIY